MPPQARKLSTCTCRQWYAAWPPVSESAVMKRLLTENLFNRSPACKPIIVWTEWAWEQNRIAGHQSVRPGSLWYAWIVLDARSMHKCSMMQSCHFLAYHVHHVWCMKASWVPYLVAAMRFLQVQHYISVPLGDLAAAWLCQMLLPPLLLCLQTTRGWQQHSGLEDDCMLAWSAYCVSSSATCLSSSNCWSASWHKGTCVRRDRQSFAARLTNFLLDRGEFVRWPWKKSNWVSFGCKLFCRFSPDACMFLYLKRLHQETQRMGMFEYVGCARLLAETPARYGQTPSIPGPTPTTTATFAKGDIMY